MQVSSQIWMTILGFISLSIVISLVTHFWIRHHLKNKVKTQAANPSSPANTTIIADQKTPK